MSKEDVGMNEVQGPVERPIVVPKPFVRVTGEVSKYPDLV